MGLETGTYVSDLVKTNPPTSDPETQGANHLQLIKTVLQNTFPDGSKPVYFPKLLSKSANYTVQNGDDNTLILADATGGSFTLTLPTPTNAGWHVRVVKIDSTANTVTVQPPAGTISGQSTIVLDAQWLFDRVEYDGTNFKNLFPQWASGILLGRYGGTVGRDKAVTVGTGLSLSSGGTLSASTSSDMVLTSNLTIVAGIASNVLTLAVKTLAGNDPSASDIASISFRSVTAGLANYTTINLTAALSIAFGANAAGSTFGSANGTPFKLWIVAFNDGGTVRLGVINCLNGTNIYPLSQMAIASSTLVGLTGSNSSQTFYTNGAGVTSKAYTVLGWLSYEAGSTLATAGSYSSLPTNMDLYRPGVALPGTEIQRQRTATGAFATGTTTVSAWATDNVPTSSMGDQYMSQAITPTSSANVLEIESQLYMQSGGGGNRSGSLLLQDSTANSLVAEYALDASSTVHTHRLTHQMLAGTLSSTTFKVRAGCDGAGTNTFNGTGGARELGGKFNSWMQVKEIAA